MTGFSERGGALVAAVGVLCTMTLLATMGLMAGGADLAIAKRLARERSSFYAAESALEDTLLELASGDNPVPEAAYHAPWSPPGVPPRCWQDGPWSCSRRVRLIPDVRDLDGDPATTVLLFNRSCGRQGSPVARGGYPVFQVLVTAESGESRQAIAAEVVPVTCAPAVTAAWTAAGPLHLSGDIRVAGAATLDAVSGSGAVLLSGGAVVEGANAVAPQEPLPADILRFLNAGATLTTLAELPEPPSGAPLRGLLWSRGDYSGPLDGEGILVVHNPSFDPVKHEASRLALEEGLLVEGRDPAYSHLDPTRQPARLGFGVGGAYRGVIVADVVGGTATAFTLTGALVTLSRSPLAVASSAQLRVLGSREAIGNAGRGALRHLTAFRPVAPQSAWPTSCP